MTETKQIFEKTKSTNFDSKYTTTLSWIDATKDDNPQCMINNNAQYKKMYLQFLKNNTKIKGIVDLSKQKQSQQQIKSFLSKSLQIRKTSQQFDDKFSQQYKIKNKKSPKPGYKKLNIYTQKIGETQQQKGQQQKNLFFSQTKKVIELEEEAMLLQYYYKDKNEYVIKNYLKNQRVGSKHDLDRVLNISYLRNRNKSESRHKRFQPSKQEFQSLMLTHNIHYFDKIKKINFFKQQKFDNQCFKRAQKNYQWKREKNFQQMQEIIKLNRENLLFESVSKNLSQQNVENQQKFNKTMRLFLKFAYLEHINKRAFYEYIDDEGTSNLISFILENEFNTKIKEKVLKQIIAKIIKYKSEPKLQFYDFMEFINTINETYSVDLLDLVTKKHPSIFIKNQQTIINQYAEEIQRSDESQKISFIAKLIFESSPEKLILNQFLPIKIFPKILSKAGITGNDIPRAKLFQFLYWNQMRPEGLNCKQFYRSFLMLGVNDNDWQHVYKLLEKVKINQLIQ